MHPSQRHLTSVWPTVTEINFDQLLRALSARLVQCKVTLSLISESNYLVDISQPFCFRFENSWVIFAQVVIFVCLFLFGQWGWGATPGIAQGLLLTVLLIPKSLFLLMFVQWQWWWFFNMLADTFNILKEVMILFVDFYRNNIILSLINLYQCRLSLSSLLVSLFWCSSCHQVPLAFIIILIHPWAQNLE